MPVKFLHGLVYSTNLHRLVNAENIRNAPEKHYLVNNNVLTSSQKLFVMGDVPGFTSASRFKEWDENEFREVPVPDPENTVVALSYSSGTTGLPKGIEITHYSIVASFCVQR